MTKAFRLIADDIGELYIENEDLKVVVEKLNLKREKLYVHNPYSISNFDQDHVSRIFFQENQNLCKKIQLQTIFRL